MIDVDDLTVALGGVTVLDDVSLSVTEGDLVGLVGPNGAGKTTLLRTISGALAPESGTVTVDGDEVHALSSKAASRRLAVVPQDAAVTFDFSVQRVVEMGRHPYQSRFGTRSSEDRDAVDDAMARVDVARFADRSIQSVSGGERQRVLLARALAQDTPVLLLDEPTASLDVTRQVETLALARDLVDDGRTAVAAIHDLDLAARFCDRLVAVADGAVVASGPPEAVLDADTVERAFGGTTAVTTNPVTGTPSVTALPDSGSATREAAVHVLGSGPGAARALTALVDAGFAPTIGPVPEGDVAAVAAEAVGAEAATVPALSPPDDDATASVTTQVDAAAVVVLAGHVPGPLAPFAGHAPRLVRHPDAHVDGTVPPATVRVDDDLVDAVETALRADERQTARPPGAQD